MEPTDPDAGKTYTFEGIDPDTGDIHQTLMSAEQILDLSSGRAVAGLVHDEQTLVDDDGTVIHRESIEPIEPSSQVARVDDGL